MTQELRDLIDAQNPEALSQYLVQNPDVDLNHITPNGASALWMAVMPPRGKDISPHIIVLLLGTGRIDPTQLQYEEKIGMRNIPSEISELVLQYEQQYVRMEAVNQDAPRVLRNIALDTQSTHDSLVVKTYDKYVEKLYRRYIVDHQERLSWSEDIRAYIDSQATYRLNTTLANSIKRILKSDDARRIEAFNVSITNAELLMLLWHALCDHSPDSFVEGIDMSPSEQIIRKNHLLDALINAQNTYGANSPACFMGTRHNMIESLDKVHHDCMPSEEESLLLPEHMVEMYATHCQEAMCALEQCNIELWRQYLQHIWQDIDNPALLNWIAQVQASFLTKINHAQHQRPPALRMTDASFTQQFALYSDPNMPLDNRVHPQARLSEQLSAIQNFLNHPETHLIQWIESCSESISQDHLNWQQLMNHDVIEDVYSESILWLILEGLFQNTPWNFWLKTLPTAVKSGFFKDLIHETVNCPDINEEKDEAQPTSDNHAGRHRFPSNRVHQVALKLAMTLGFWREFPIEQTLTFDNQDLRGFDFSNIDLSRMTFRNCDLRLTGILSNPTLTREHLESGNQIEQDAIIIAARHNFLKTLDILTDSPGWEKQAYQNVKDNLTECTYTITPLLVAAECGNFDAVQMILKHTSDEELKNAKNGCDSIYRLIDRRSPYQAEDIAIAILEKYASPTLYHAKIGPYTLFISALNQHFNRFAEAMLLRDNTLAWDKDGTSATALFATIRFCQKNIPMHKMILEKIPPHVMKDVLRIKAMAYGETPFSMAAMKGNVDITRAILKIDATDDILNHRIFDGRTVLMRLAVRNVIEPISEPDYTGVINAILESNSTEAVINARQKRNDLLMWSSDVSSNVGNTALIEASLKNNVTVVKAILKYNPTLPVINAINNSGRTALITAVEQNHPEIVRAILDINASDAVINARAPWLSARTALTAAAEENRPEMVRIILAYNSAESVINARTGGGITAFQIAMSKGYFDVIKTILEYNHTTAVIHAPGRGEAEIKTLIAEKMRSPRYLLELQIQQLKTYGEQLWTTGRSLKEISAGDTAIDLATRLTRCLNTYYLSPESTRQTHKDEFNHLLRTGYHDMAEYIRPGFFHRLLISIASLFQCLFASTPETITPIGEVTAGFFFQTTRQKEVHKISTLFEQFNP